MVALSDMGNLRIVFRVDASAQIGSGHLMRCMNLAHELVAQGGEVCFIAREHPGHSCEQIVANGYTLFRLPTPVDASYSTGACEPEHAGWIGVSWQQDAAETLVLLQEWGQVDWLVVDHYGLDARWEKQLSEHVDQIMVIDDLADRLHCCDILFDQTMHAGYPSRYDALVPASCYKLLGPGSVLLKNGFERYYDEAWRDKEKRQKNLLVALGGTRNDTLLKTILEKITPLVIEQDLRVKVVYRDYPSIQSGLEDGLLTRCEFFGFVENFAELLKDVGYAIGAGGVITYERLYYGIPAVVFVIADNQRQILQDIEELGLLKVTNLEALQQDLTRLMAGHLCDIPQEIVGNGTGRVARLLMHRGVELRTMNQQDIERTYSWIQNPRFQEYFPVNGVPELNKHCEYWSSKLDSPQERCYAIYRLGRHIGNCGFKHIDTRSRSLEYWVYIGEESMWGKGLGGYIQALVHHEYAQIFPDWTLYLHVKKDNTRAVRLYERSGYRVVEKDSGSIWGETEEMVKMIFQERVKQKI